MFVGLKETARKTFVEMIGKMIPDSEVIGISAEVGSEVDCLLYSLADYVKHGFEDAYSVYFGRVSSNNVERKITDLLVAGACNCGQQRLAVLCCGQCDLREIKSLVDACTDYGVKLVMSVLPEYASAFDNVHSLCPITTRDLLVRDDEYIVWGLNDHDVQSMNVSAKTCRIPKLVASFDPFEANEIISDNEPIPAYDNSLAEVVCGYLRESLSKTALLSRLVITILGTGSFQDVSDVLEENCDHELTSINRHNVLFNFDMNSGTFDFVGKNNECVYAKLKSEKSSLLEDNKAIVLRCLDLLAKSGDYSRIGMLAEALLDGEDFSMAISKYPFEFINNGQSSFLRRAYQLCENKNSLTSITLSMSIAIQDGDIEEAKCLFKQLSLQEGVNRDLIYCAYCLLKIINLRKTVNPLNIETPAGFEQSSNILVNQLRNHYLAVKNLVFGEAEKTYALLMLLNISKPTNLIESLLYIDYYVASLLLGDTALLNDVKSINSAISCVESSGVKGVKSYSSCVIDVLKSLLGFNEFTRGAEKSGCVADAQHDYVVAAISLVISALQDTRDSNTVRSFVRTRLAKQAAEKADYKLGLKLAQLVECVANNQFVSEDKECVQAHFEELSAPESLIVSLMILFSSNNISTQIELITAQIKPPLGMLWLMDYILESNPILKSDYLEALPQSWVNPYKKFVASKSKCITLTKKGAPEVKEVESRPILKVNLLGECRICVGNKEILEKDWRRAASRDLLLLLCISDNHMIKRSDAQQILWPEKDYVRARSNLYTVVSVMKKTIGHSDKVPYILSNQGFISLNGDLIDIDIDRFDQLAQRIIRCDGAHGEVMDDCDKLSKIFKGKLFMPIGDISGVYLAKSDELNKLSSDAMCMGAEIALIEHQPRRAAWYARKALEVDPVREDAAILLMQALSDTGRQVEMREVYSTFSTRLALQTNLMPTEKFNNTYKKLTRKEDSKNLLNVIDNKPITSEQ